MCTSIVFDGPTTCYCIQTDVVVYKNRETSQAKYVMHHTNWPRLVTPCTITSPLDDVERPGTYLNEWKVYFTTCWLQQWKILIVIHEGFYYVVGLIRLILLATWIVGCVHPLSDCPLHWLHNSCNIWKGYLGFLNINHKALVIFNEQCCHIVCLFLSSYISCLSSAATRCTHLYNPTWIVWAVLPPSALTFITLHELSKQCCHLVYSPLSSSMSCLNSAAT